MKALSAWTRAEQEAGRGNGRLALAWTRAGQLEQDLGLRRSRGPWARVSVIPADFEDGVIEMVVIVGASPNCSDPLILREPLEGFPSDLLRARLMLLVG